MDKMETINTFLLMAALFIIIIVSIIGVNHAISTPTALDVYRGKTTLQITYKDSVPIDSVVVFK